MHPTIPLPAVRHALHLDQAGAPRADRAATPAPHRLRSVLGVCALTLLLLALCACAGDPTGPVPAGTWGGSQGTLVVYGDSATLDLPCAVGRIPAPLVADAGGRFDLAGFWAIQAGPIGIGGANWQPARFSGQRDGDVVQLTIRLSSGTDVGPLTLRRGVVGQFPRCL